MKRATKYALSALAMLFVTSEMMTESGALYTRLPGVVSKAEAAVVVRRRPAAPASVAGVARRTTRRVIRRGAYIASIPVGCAYGTYYGYNLYYCGGVYYQKSGSGYVIVYF